MRVGLFKLVKYCVSILCVIIMLIVSVGCGLDTADNNGISVDMVEDWEMFEIGDMSGGEDMGGDDEDMIVGEEDMVGEDFDMEVLQDDMGVENVNFGEDMLLSGLCVQDECVEDGVCIVCVFGIINDVGDDMLGVDIFCEVIICE